MTWSDTKLHRIMQSVNWVLLVMRQALEKFYWWLVIAMGNRILLFLTVGECNIEKTIWKNIALSLANQNANVFTASDVPYVKDWAQSKPVFTCSKSRMETPDYCVKSVYA